MPPNTFRGGTPDDGTYEVGTGPFRDLPAGTYKGNFYGNDPRLGLIRAGDQRYSLLSSQDADVASSGNTFQVGTGPQPNLPSGIYRPGEITSFLREQERAAAAAAAQPPPAPVSPTPIAGPAVPVQTTLPNPVTPVAAPTFFPSTGLPNFGSSNLLTQTSLPGTPGGLPNVPNIVSPLQPLLETPSTLPATGTSVPNISSNLGSQSVFTQLFPSVPDISLQPTATATAADGGPILASDYLPRYEDGGEAEKALESEIITELNEIFVERGGMSPPQFYELVRGKSLPELVAIREAQRNADKSFSDRFPSLRGFSSPDDSPRNYYPPGYEFPEEGPTELDAFDSSPDMMEDLGRSMEDEIPPRAGEFQEDYHRYYQPIVPYVDPDLPEPVRRSIEQGGFYGPEAANGGPILASEYLNAGGPVQYFQGGQGVNSGALSAAAPLGHFPAYITSDEAEMLRAQGGGVTPDGGQYMANGIPVFQSENSFSMPGDFDDPRQEGETDTSPTDTGTTSDLSDVVSNYGKSTLASGLLSLGSLAFGPLASVITGPPAVAAFTKGLTDDENTQATSAAQKAGQVAAKYGLSLSKNQSYPGDLNYGKTQDEIDADNTAFSPSTFNIDDPLQGGQ